jgi:hypothetical protein
MKNPMTIVKGHPLRASFILPLAFSAAFTGCSGINGTGGNQPAIKSRASPCVRPDQEKPAGTAGEFEAYPGYEWWY